MGTTAMAFDFKARWARASVLMERAGLDALLIMKPANLAYLTGDGRPCALGLLTRTGRCTVVVPASDLASVRRDSAADDIRAFPAEAEMLLGFRDILREHRLEEAAIGLEKNFCDVALFEVLTAHLLPKAQVKSAVPVLSQLRMLKEPAEVECLKDAARVADAGMAAAVGAIAPGVRETDVAGEAELAMRRAGATGWASATYVASGWRSALAHGPASLKTMERGEAVQVHVAPIAKGYTVDLCRTVLIGDVSNEIAWAADAYVEAEEVGILAARPGTALMGIDTAMETRLAAAGFTEAFTRPVFHGVGIEHEEAPIPSGHAMMRGDDAVDRIQAGMVLAIGNCGIYRETYGVRFEDTVWVSDDGPVPLTRHPKIFPSVTR